MANKTSKDKGLSKSKKKDVVANCDQLPAKMVNFNRSNVDIESLIRTIRGQKVMVDFDLAMLYGEKTKRLNEQVKRNINRFPDDFMFQLDNKEWNVLRSQIATTEVIEDEYVTLLRSQIATAKDGTGLWYWLCLGRLDLCIGFG